MMMKKVKPVLSAVLAAVLAASLSACSIVDSITEPEVDEEASVSSDESLTSGKTVDTTLAEPVFEVDLNYSTIIAVGSELTLNGTAISGDGGTITYQWYSNNVNSNGGGTVISGETDALYTVDASETGTVYYYVVASNEHGDSYNMTVSPVSEVVVIASGTWVTDEYGGTRYIAEDGSYPADAWVLIGTDSYLFNAEGYRQTGWLYTGEHYIYFDEEGRYQPDAVAPEGIYVDENGSVIVPATSEESATTEAATSEETATTETATTEEATTEEVVTEEAVTAE